MIDLVSETGGIWCGLCVGAGLRCFRSTLVDLVCKIGGTVCGGTGLRCFGLLLVSHGMPKYTQLPHGFTHSGSPGQTSRIHPTKGPCLRRHSKHGKTGSLPVACIRNARTRSNVSRLSVVPSRCTMSRCFCRLKRVKVLWSASIKLMSCKSRASIFAPTLLEQSHNISRKYRQLTSAQV